MFAERQGLHLPESPISGSNWEILSPMQGIQVAGIGFFGTKFDLSFPRGYDIPLKIELGGDNATSKDRKFRVQVFVNG